MSILKDLCGSYCKVAVTSSSSSKGIVQTGFIKNVDTKHNIMTLENENGVVQISFQEIRAVKKIK